MMKDPLHPHVNFDEMMLSGDDKMSGTSLDDLVLNSMMTPVDD